MRAVRTKLVILFLAVGFSSAAILFAYRYLRKEYIPQRQAIEEIEEFYEEPPAPPDPGLRQFAKAVSLLKSGEEQAARAEMLQIMAVYPESLRTPMSKRILTELNLDRLLSRRPMPGKLDYLVQRGDALAAIAREHHTTLAFLRLVNGVSSYNIHPGDRFVLYPMEFEVEVSLSEQTLTLNKDGIFFAEFRIADVAVPKGLRIPTKMQVSASSAWRGEEKVGFSDADYGTAAKWVQLKRPGSPVGLVLATADQKERLGAGLFFDPGTMEELFAIMRDGLIVSISG